MIYIYDIFSDLTFIQFEFYFVSAHLKKALQYISTLFQTSLLKKIIKVQIPKIIPKIILNYQQKNELHSFPTYGEEKLDVNMLWILRKN